MKAKSNAETVLVEYNAGNIRSVLLALERIGVHACVSGDPERIYRADKVIFPGVGEASSAMQYLKERDLDQVIKALKVPVLGICLGMQLMCSYSEEGDTEGLGIFETRVQRFQGDFKIPHMGWNTINQLHSPLFAGIETGCWQYFVHGYYAGLCKETIAISDYFIPFSSALHKNNFYGVQFHPEKSGDAGQQILKNFIQL